MAGPFGELGMEMLPDTVNGLPLHALSVHGTVVLVPLLALLGVLYAVPRLRRWARWPLGLVAVGAAGSTWVSMESGEALQTAGGQGAAGIGGPVADALDRHIELADQLEWMVYAYAIIALIAVLLVRPGGRRDTHAASDRAATEPTGSSRGSGLVAVVASIALVLGAVAVGVQVARVGDAGAKTVWNPDDSVDYSAD